MIGKRVQFDDETWSAVNRRDALAKSKAALPTQLDLL